MDNGHSSCGTTNSNYPPGVSLLLLGDSLLTSTASSSRLSHEEISQIAAVVAEIIKPLAASVSANPLSTSSREVTIPPGASSSMTISTSSGNVG